MARKKEWIAAAERDADVVYGGGEYMLTAFAIRHPDFVDAATRVSLFDRAGGIIARQGNPKNIRSLKDLTRSGINLVDVSTAPDRPGYGRTLRR